MQSYSLSSRDVGGSRQRPTYAIDDESVTEDDNGKLVLVVDDSQMICRIVKFSLEHYGINTVPFYSGIDALSALDEGTVPIPDLVLLDIGMPVMNGYDVTSLLRGHKALRDVPIVMLSGHDGIFDRFRARRVGADDFIAKPFERAELLRKVFSLLKLALPDDFSDNQD